MGGGLENKIKSATGCSSATAATPGRPPTTARSRASAPPRRQEFLDNYYALNRPVVIEGAMDDWPAMTRVDVDKLKRRFGDRTVEVQANRETPTPTTSSNSTSLQEGDEVRRLRRHHRAAARPTTST